MNHSTGTIRIVAAVLDTSKLTLYLVDGSTITVAQGDPRVRRIIDDATPQIIANKYADISLAMDVHNSYKEFEEKSSNKIRFFRVAKEKLKEFFGFTSVASNEEPDKVHLQIGAVPVEEVPDATEPSVVEDLEIVGKVDHNPAMPVRSKEVNQSVIDEIMQHATPSSDPMFSEEGLDKQAPITENGVTPSKHSEDVSKDTIIAVTQDNMVVPGMERIKNQFTRAAKLGSTAGVERFLERLGKVIQHRRHSVDDLLKFMERGDLPIADDGCILIYKVLNKRTFAAYPWAAYADCHSGNVPQAVGCRVQMSEALVDPNRNNECSNGLHVARRGYVSNFHGSVCVLAKLAPEDVIAVPTYDANKMRACGYNIIFELSDEMYSLVKANRPISEHTEGRSMLARALAGQHTKVFRIVEITEQKGGGIKITNLKTPPWPPPTPPATPAPKPAATADALENEAEALDNPIDLKEIVSQVEDLSYKGRAAKLVVSIQQETDSEKLGLLYRELLQIKRASKYSWERLGVPQQIAEDVMKVTEPSPAVGVPVLDSEPAAATETDNATTLTAKESESGSRRIQTLLAITPMTEQTATSILQLKKKSKKGWAALHVSESMSQLVERLATAK